MTSEGGNEGVNAHLLDPNANMSWASSWARKEMSLGRVSRKNLSIQVCTYVSQEV